MHYEGITVQCEGRNYSIYEDQDGYNEGETDWGDMHDDRRMGWDGMGWMDG